MEEKTKGAGIINALTGLKSKSRKSGVIQDIEKEFRKMTTAMKDSGNSQQAECGKQSSKLGDVSFANADRVAFIGEKQISSGSKTRKVTPEECKKEFIEAKTRNPAGNYTGWCTVAGQKLNVSGRTVRAYIKNPNPRTRKQTRKKT